MVDRRLQAAFRLGYSAITRHFPRQTKFKSLPFAPLQTRLDTIPCEQACFVEEQLSRVRKCGFGSTIVSELEYLKATSWTEKPTLACELEDVFVLGGELFTDGGRFMLSRRSPVPALKAEFHEFEDIVIPNSRLGLYFFGHWLGDDCPAYEYFGNHKKTISMRRPHWPDSKYYETAFRQSWLECDSVYAKCVTVVEDISYNLDKGRRIENLRSRVSEGVRPQPGIVYIARGTFGKERAPVNESSLVDYFISAGIRIVRPESGGDAVIKECIGADVVITVEGSQARHAKYALRPGGALLILQPPDRFYNPHIQWSRLLGMRYGIVIGTAEADGFSIDAGEVMYMLDRLIANSAQSVSA